MGHAYTEGEAGTKWCPEARVPVAVTVHQDLKHVTAVNRQPESRDPFAGARCVGSLCPHWQYLSGKRNTNAKGYCGLSGPPST
jgi:hypothetical protein